MTALTPTAELREKVYEFILRSGAAGLTDEEISKGLKIVGDVARPRRNELVQADRVVNSGTRRVTKRGRTAIVWRAVKKAAAKKTVVATPVATKATRTASKPALKASVKVTAKAATKPVATKAVLTTKKPVTRRARR